jgi:hypothetical protein
MFRDKTARSFRPVFACTSAAVPVHRKLAAWSMRQILSVPALSWHRVLQLFWEAG